MTEQQADFLCVVDRFLAGQLSAAHLQQWAENLEVREDVAFDEKDDFADLADEDREMLEHYLSGTGDRLAKLSAALSAAKQGGAGSKEDLRNALHKLAGSAGTFGFTGLGEMARDLEKRVVAADDPIAEDILLDVISMRHEMEQTFEEARSRIAPRPEVQHLSAIRQKLADWSGSPDDAEPADVVVNTHRLLAQAPSMILTATLDDAAVVEERPNIPGTSFAAGWAVAWKARLAGTARPRAKGSWWESFPALRATRRIPGSTCPSRPESVRRRRRWWRWPWTAPSWSAAAAAR